MKMTLNFPRTLTFIFACNVILFSLVPHFAKAESNDKGRKVVLDWEPIGGAYSYDLEIGLPNEKAAIKNEHTIPRNKWEGILAPGQYWMRIRARDDRGLPGDWSDRMDITIKLAKVEVLRPSHEAVINTVTDKLDVLFSWKPTFGAKNYIFNLEDEQGKTIVTKTIPNTSYRIELPGMAAFRWTVQAIDEKGELGEAAPSQLTFAIEGPGLESPVITKPETIYVREIEFVKPKGAASVEVQFERLDKNSGDWVTMPLWEEKGSVIVFPQDWPGGHYKLSLRAQARYQAASNPAVLELDIFDGERTAEREDVALTQKAIDRADGWFSRFSYVVTKMNYQGVNYETDVKPQFEAFTGTASAQFSKYFYDLPIGFNVGGGLGGILLNGKNTLLASVESSLLFRQPFGDTNEIRLSLGFNLKEIPEARATTNLSSGAKTLSISKITYAGPQLGVEYWRGIDRKLGLQVHAFMSRLGQGQTASGVKLTKGQSLSMGAMGSYRFSREVTWLGGYTFSNDAVVSPGSNTATLKAGSNQTILTAHYLHFMVEYDY